MARNLTSHCNLVVLCALHSTALTPPTVCSILNMLATYYIRRYYSFEFHRLEKIIQCHQTLSYWRGLMQCTQSCASPPLDAKISHPRVPQRPAARMNSAATVAHPAPLRLPCRRPAATPVAAHRALAQPMHCDKDALRGFYGSHLRCVCGLACAYTDTRCSY